MEKRRNIKARYFVRDLGMQTVAQDIYDVDKDGKLFATKVENEHHCFMVMFPSSLGKGHSIRVLGHDRLKELGYHLKPKMVDMDTGETVDFGGDPYDFANDHSSDELFAAEAAVPRARRAGAAATQ